MNNILSVENLCLWYGSHQALKDINIEIPEKSNCKTRLKPRYYINTNGPYRNFEVLRILKNM